MDTGQTQYSSPFVSEIKPDLLVLAEEPTAYWGEATHPTNAVVRPEVVVSQPPVDQPTQARDSLTKTVPKARIIPNRVVMTTSGANVIDGSKLRLTSCTPFSRLLGKNQLQKFDHDTSPA